MSSVGRISLGQTVCTQRSFATSVGAMAGTLAIELSDRYSLEKSPGGLADRNSFLISGICVEFAPVPESGGTGLSRSKWIWNRRFL
ncbi:MAG: hypothetical protein HKL82_06670 [Acidimicrobiaceae bacterium]|nr:hypothetical protein [Acidimicrobiaceae bacterium]